MTKRRKQHIRSQMQVGHYLNRDDQPSGMPEYEIPPVTPQLESTQHVQASRAIGHTLRFILGKVLLYRSTRLIYMFP